MDAERTNFQEQQVSIEIYVMEHCSNCDYAHEVADVIRQDFPQVKIDIVDVHRTTRPIPEAVFATPTYLLNGRLWSLGNPSLQEVHERLARELA